MISQEREQALERELFALRKLYGAKFNAIAAALGWATEASDRLRDGDESEGIAALDKVVSILVDA